MTHLSLSLLLSVAAGLCRGQLGISPQDMQNAVNTLSERFTTIRNEGLGVDLLEVSFFFLVCLLEYDSHSSEHTAVASFDWG